MSEVKWIKICTDIFEDEKIKLIEAMPDGDSIIVIWFKLLCMAGKNNNDGIFMVTDKIAYNDEMLATIFNRTISQVRMALEVFKGFEMIDIINNTITISNWGSYQSIEKLKALRDKEYHKTYMREYREKQKTLEAPQEEKKKETKRFVKPTIEDVQKYCEEKEYKNFECQVFIDYYESVDWKRGNTPIKNWKRCINTWVNKNPNKYKKQVTIERHNDF